MSFVATLYLDDTQRRILNANYVIRQGMDLYQRPNAFPHGGYISIKLETSGDDDTLWEWAISPTMMRNGKIRFYRRDGQSRMADLEFWDAYCINLSESYSAYGKAAMTLQLILSPGVVRFRHAVFEKHWKVTDLSLVGTTGSAYSQDEEEEVIEEENPKILECYYENSKGDKIEKVRKNKTIYLVVKSQDMTGKKVNIDLSNNNIDFEYNGSILENDLLENIEVTGSPMRIELKTINQRK